VEEGYGGGGGGADLQLRGVAPSSHRNALGGGGGPGGVSGRHLAPPSGAAAGSGGHLAYHQGYQGQYAGTPAEERHMLHSKVRLECVCAACSSSRRQALS
jgi:hypothetical protein